MIEIASSVPLMTVQDLGRQGAYQYGVCRSGAMDRLALSVGNALLGNEADAAGLEIPLAPVKFLFHEDTNFALTGADCHATLDANPIPAWWAMPAKKGQMLHLGAPRQGARAYLTLSGGFDVPQVLGSRSTQLRESFGGFEGRAVTKGDVVRGFGNDVALPVCGIGALPPKQALQFSKGTDIAVRVIRAAEYDGFTQASVDEFWAASWEVTAQSNRAGFRLAGPELALVSKLELRSHGIVPGVIQVPPGGQPIIQLADAATMGGYPKIGTVIEADLWRVGQAVPGQKLRFVDVEYQTALDALDDVATYLNEVRASATRLRSASQKWGQV